MTINSIMSADFVIEEWRDLWSFKADYVIVCIAYIFSVNNLATLQGDIKQYGGGVFALSYLISLLVVCLPLIMMELATGQLTGRSPFQAIGRICPLFKGVGLGFIVLSLVVASIHGITVGYYAVYIVHLAVGIANNELPWHECHHSWSSKACEALIEATTTEATTDVANASAALPLGTGDPDPALIAIAAKDFYEKYIQNISGSIGAPGDLVWRPIAGSGAAWLLVFIAVFLGVRWLGKVCYFTVIIPLILLIGLTIRALTLENMEDEIAELFKTDWNYFLDKDMWCAAFSRSLLAVGLCFGSYITLGSYCKRSNNMVSDSCLLILVHILFVGAQLFVSIGFQSQVPQAAKGSLAFDSILGILLSGAGYTRMGHLWSALMLLMVVFFTLNTMYVLTFTTVAALEDTFLSHLGSRVCPRALLSLGVCCLGFGLGLGYTVQSGPHAHQLISKFFDYFPYWILLFFEIIAIAWFYCGHLLGRDIRQMVHNSCCWCWGYVLCYVLYLLPVVPIYILVMKLWHYKSPTDEHIYSFNWVEPIAWLCAITPVLLIPLLMIYVLTRSCLKGPGISCWEKFKHTISSPMRYEVIKPRTAARYTSTSPGYVLIPNAPLAEPEMYNENEYGERVLKVSNI